MEYLTIIDLNNKIININFHGVTTTNIKKNKYTEKNIILRILFMAIYGYYTAIRLYGISFNVNVSENNMLQLKIGFSHVITVKIPSPISIKIKNDERKK